MPKSNHNYLRVQQQLKWPNIVRKCQKVYYSVISSVLSQKQKIKACAPKQTVYDSGISNEVSF